MSKIVTLEADKQPEKTARRMNKINTTLLSICTAGILWMAKEVNSLDSRMSSLESTVQEKTVNLSLRVDEIKVRQDREFPKIYELDARMDVLESRLPHR